MGKFWVIVLVALLVSGCKGMESGYTHVSAVQSGPAASASWRESTAAWHGAERYSSYSEWEEARARRERRRWEAEESYRRWFRSLTEEEREEVRRRERELDAMLEALAGNARHNA